MSITASSLIALVETRGAQESAAQLLEVGAASDTAGTKLKNLAVGGLLVAGAAAVGLGVESVKMAGDFQQSVTKLYTTAGEAHSNLKMVGDGMLAMSSQVGTGAQKLGDAMYWIESGGLHGAKALEALRVAAQAAKAENADLDKVSIALAASLNAYAGSGMTDVQVMNTLTAATGQGMMTFEQLSGSLSSVLPASAKFHISLKDVTAALADMTAQGDPASQAATHLKQVILALEAPAKGGAAALKSVGLTSTEVANEMKVSLPDALQMITDAVGKKFPEGSAAYNAAIKNIAGGSKQMMGFLELTGSHMAAFTENVKKIGDAVKAGGNDLMGWSDIQQNFNFKVDSAKASVEALGIKIGTMLLPVASKLFDVVTPLVTQFSNWVGTLSQFGDEVAKATAPVKQIQEYLAPLPDAFDHATGAIHTISNALHPLVDTFDHAKSVIGATTVATKPLVDSFDRATVIIPKVTTFVTKAKDAVSPLVTLFLYWKPVLQETVTTLETLAGDVATFATGIADAADKSGAFQSAIQFIHDLLPQVDTFLVNVGGDIDKEVLPPLESLITNTGYVISDFVTWADKSGTATSAIADLGTAVGITASVVGTLVQGLSDLIGWFDQDAPQAYILAGAVTAVGLAFAGLKVANTVVGFQQMFLKLSEGDGIVTNLASKFKDKLSTAIDDIATKQFPNLKKATDSVTESADAAAEAEVKVASAPASAKASSQAWFADLEGSLGDVENQANAASIAEEGVGTTAETTMAEGVTAGSVESEASLSGITAAADEAAIAEETVGTTAETKMAGGVEAGAASGSEAIGGMSGGLIGMLALLATIGTQLEYDAVKGHDFFGELTSGDWQSALGFLASVATPGGETAAAGDLFTHLAQDMGILSASSQDTAKKVSKNFADTKTNTVQSATEMAQGITGEYSWMKNESLSTVQGFTSSATAILGKLGSDGTRIMQSLDKSTQLYWNDIANYIDMKSNQAAMEANQNLGKIHVNGQTYGNINNIGNRNANDSSNALPGHASGGFTTPGWSIMNERGGEMVKLPGGSYVIPHDMSMNMMSSGGGSNSQPIHVHVHIADQEFTYLTNAVMDSAARQTRLRYGSRRF